MRVKQEVPIKSFSIAAYICRIREDKSEYLVIKRSTAYLKGVWQMVTGSLEEGETAWQAALREIKEETGLVPDRLYSSNELEIFYEVGQNCINLVPVFVGFMDSEQAVSLSHEHCEHRWISPGECKNYLPFEQQWNMIMTIERNFVRNTPPEFLRITG